MKLIPLNEVEEFMILAKNVHDNSGKVLLKKDTVLTSNYIDRLRNFGVNSLYVIDGLTCDSNIEESDSKGNRDVWAAMEPEEFAEPVHQVPPLELPQDNHLLKENEIQETAKGDTMLEAIKTANDILDTLVGTIQPFDLEAVRSGLPFLTTDMSGFKYETDQPVITGMGAVPDLAGNTGMTTGISGAGMGFAPGVPGPDFLTTGAIGAAGDSHLPPGYQGMSLDYQGTTAENQPSTIGFQGAPTGYQREAQAVSSTDPLFKQVGADPGAGMVVSQNPGVGISNLQTRLVPAFLTTDAIRNGMTMVPPEGYFGELQTGSPLGPIGQRVDTPAMGEGYTKNIAPEAMNSINGALTPGQEPGYFTTGAIRNATNPEASSGFQSGGNQPPGATREIQTGNTPVSTSQPVGAGPGAVEGYSRTIPPVAPNSGNRLEPQTFTTGAIRNVTNPEAANFQPVGNQPTGATREIRTGYSQTAPPEGAKSGNRIEPNTFTTGAIRNLTNSEAAAGTVQEIPTSTPSGPMLNPIRREANSGAGTLQSAGATFGVGSPNSNNRPESNTFTTGAIGKLTNNEAPAGYGQEVSAQTPLGPVMNSVRPETNSGGGSSKTVAPGGMKNETRLQPNFLTTGAIGSATNTGGAGVGSTYQPPGPGGLVSQPVKPTLESQSGSGLTPIQRRPDALGGGVSNIQAPPENSLISTQSLKNAPDGPGSPAIKNVQSTETGTPFSMYSGDRDQMKGETLQITNSIVENLMGKVDVQKLTVERAKAGITNITDTIIANLSGQTITEDFRNEIKLEAYQISKDTISGIQDGIVRSETLHKTVNGLLAQLMLNERILHLIVNLRAYNEGLFVHSMAVGVLAIIIGVGAGYSPEILKDLGAAALLHDIGKAFLPKGLLEKKEALTENEKREIQKHPIYGYEFLHKFEDLPPIAGIVALRHHEYMDGSGYPYHLKKNEINHYARIVTLADAYDVLTKNDQRFRDFPYEIVEYFRDMSHSIFDREVTRIFLQNIQPFPVGSMVLLNNGEKAIISKLSKDLPARPRVRVVINKAGDLLKKPVEYNLEEDLTLFVIRVLST